MVKIAAIIDLIRVGQRMDEVDVRLVEHGGGDADAVHDVLDHLFRVRYPRGLVPLVLGAGAVDDVDVVVQKQPVELVVVGDRDQLIRHVGGCELVQYFGGRAVLRTVHNRYGDFDTNLLADITDQQQQAVDGTRPSEVARDEQREVVDAADGLVHREQVEYSLGGVFVCAVAAADHCSVALLALRASGR